MTSDPLSEKSSTVTDAQVDAAIRAWNGWRVDFPINPVWREHDSSYAAMRRALEAAQEEAP